jgi:hypothetical protein
MGNVSKKEYDFTLILIGLEDMNAEIADKLYEAGCDDALVGCSNGVTIASFDREGNSFEEVVLSAMNDIRGAAVGVTGFRLDSRDLVTLADVGRRIGKTRQSISLYARGKLGPGGFPAPEINAKDPLYSWADVAGCLRNNNLLSEEAAHEADSRRLVGSTLEFAFARRQRAEKADILDKLVRCAEFTEVA